MRFRGIEVSDLPDTLAAGDLFGAVAMPGFAALADAHPDGLMVLDAAGVVIAYNQAAASIHDLARDQAVGASIAELAERSALAFGELAEALQNDRRADLFATSSGGRGILVSVRPVRDRRRDTLLTLVVVPVLSSYLARGVGRGQWLDAAAAPPAAAPVPATTASPATFVTRVEA